MWSRYSRDKGAPRSFCAAAPRSDTPPRRFKSVCLLLSTEQTSNIAEYVVEVADRGLRQRAAVLQVGQNIVMGLIRRLPGLLYVHRYTIYVFAVLLLTFVYFLFKWNLLCTNLQAWQHVNKMCQFHEKGTAMGLLCAPLCTSKEVESVTCHSFGSTKEAVFSLEWRGTRIVFKSASKENIQSIHWFDNGIKKYPSEKELAATINTIIRNKLNLTLPLDTLARLTRLSPGRAEEDAELRKKEMEDLWVLLQDNEYLLSIVYADRDVFPQLLGTCGTYFGVEYAEPFRDSSSLISMEDSKETWGKKLKTAALIMELLEELENGFKEPLYLCDIKLEHFGLVKNGVRMKYIDLNHVYPKTLISSLFSRIEECAKDEDCEILDCRSYCDKTRNRCARQVSNSNLQVVCEKLFLGWRLSNTVLVPGLLMSQHTPSELASILRQCAHPQGESGKARSSPDDEVKKRLYNTVIEMEQTINNDMFL